MSLTGFSAPTETPNFYSSATNVGSTFSGSYSLTGSWGSGLNSPYIYVNFQSAGPVPVYAFCSDSNVYLQCRVYSNFIYLVVAQLKSTSASSFTFNKGSAVLMYPPTQFNANYGATIYVGTGSWQYSSSISRSISNLTPISTNTFLIYSDKYGSNKASYDTNIFFAINTNGQYLYNYAGTQSQILITWTGLSAGSIKNNCRAWIQGDPFV